MFPRRGCTPASQGLVRSRVATLLLAGGLSALGAAATAGEAGAPTPEQLMTRVAAAAAANDVTEFARCLAPAVLPHWGAAKLRQADVMMTMLGGGEAPDPGNPVPDAATAATQVAAFAAREEPILDPEELDRFYRAILGKHGIGGRTYAGLTGPELEAAFAGVDVPALVADVRALVDSLVPPAERRPDGLLAGFPRGTPAVKVRGDSAEAKVDGTTLELVRLDGRWYLHLEPRR
jgi:hypothetical protein